MADRIWTIPGDNSGWLEPLPPQEVVVIGSTSIIKLESDLPEGTLIMGQEAFNALITTAQEEQH